MTKSCGSGRILLVVLLAVFLFCFPVVSQADEVLLEGGLGFYKSYNSEAVFLRYQKYVSPFFGLGSYYSPALATWSGQTRNSAIILTKGFRWYMTESLHADFEGGGAYLDRTTQNLGTHFQFAFRVAMGVKLGTFDLGLGYNHFSNGKGVFQWTKTANLSENFVSLHVGYMF
jgi:hypothetical protein